MLVTLRDERVNVEIKYQLKEKDSFTCYIVMQNLKKVAFNLQLQV